MKLITKIVSAIRPVQFLFTALICTILFVTTIAPAQAGMMSSRVNRLMVPLSLTRSMTKLKKPSINLQWI